MLRAVFIAVLSSNACDLAVADDHALDRRIRHDLSAVRLERRRQRVGDRAHAAACEAPRADRSVDVAHVVMQQDVSGARRVHAHCRADDAAARQVRLDEIRFEVLAEKVGDAHRVEADGVVDRLLAELRELLAQIDHLPDVPRPQRRRVRRRAHEQRADELALTHHVRRIALICVRIPRVVTREFAALHVVIGVVAQNVAGARDRHATAVRHDLQSVARQLQIAEELRPQQAAHVGAVRVDPAFLNLTADRGAADPRVALQHQHLEARAREISRIGQAVVSGADDDGIVALHGFAAPLTSTMRLRSRDLAHDTIDRRLESFERFAEATLVMRLANEPGLARVRFAQHAQIMQLQGRALRRRCSRCWPNHDNFAAAAR